MHTHRSRAAVIGLGLLSLIGILTVLVAIPAALWTFGGNPLPDHLPSIAEATARLGSPDAGALFLGTLKLLGVASEFGLVRVPEMNMSSTNTIVTILIVMATVPLFAAILRVPFSIVAPMILMVCAIGVACWGHI